MEQQQGILAEKRRALQHPWCAPDLRTRCKLSAVTLLIWRCTLEATCAGQKDHTAPLRQPARFARDILYCCSIKIGDRNWRFRILIVPARLL